MQQIPANDKPASTPRRRLQTMALWLLPVVVLLAHWVTLSWLREQAQDFQPLVALADPLFTRFIQPVPENANTQRPQSRPRPDRVPSKNTTATMVAGQVSIPPAAATDLANQEASGATQQPDAAGTHAPAPEQGERDGQNSESTAPELAEAPAAPDSWPVDTRVSYQLKGFYRGDIYGSARVQWQREQNRYQVRVDLSMALVVRVSMTSQGEVTDAGLLPRVYEERFPGSLQRMAFEGGYVRFNDGTQLPQPPSLQDTASQFVELSRRFATGREVLKVGGQVEVWLARPQGMALWTYDVIEEETLQTPELGAVQAFHLRPRPIANPRGVITAEMWFAPSLQYLPLRVRISLGADNFVDLIAESIEQGVVSAVADPGAASLR